MVGRGGSTNLYRRADGVLFLGSLYAVQQSTDEGRSWTEIENSPGPSGLVGDGTTLYGVVRADRAQPLYRANENDPTTWTSMLTPDWSPDGGIGLAFDRTRHVLYASTERNGLWRYVTQ
jgi:hypothetical protein